MTKTNQQSRQKRGEADTGFIAKFYDFSDTALIGLLNDSDAQTRTASAQILGERKSINAIFFLCKRLEEENALYSKIALSNALGNIGLTALPELIPYISRIGKNQHHKLPDTIFRKWNYPLPRDIVIRIIVKMGKPALTLLCNALSNSNSIVTSELVDAIGHISFYSKDQHSLKDLLKAEAKFENNAVTTWKILRALQSFSAVESIEVLNKYFLHSPLPELRWEAARSLGQLGKNTVLEMGLEDTNKLVKEMVALGLERASKIRTSLDVQI